MEREYLMMSVPKVIVFGNSHHNTLGLVRSLGEKGIRSILLLEPCDLKFCCVRFSKYIAKIHYLKTLEDGLRVLREEYWDEKDKPIALNAGDPSMSLLDAHYGELKEHFHIFNARGEQGLINYFMDKANQFPIAEKCGLNIIKTWHLNAAKDLPSDLTYPCLLKGNNSTGSSKADMFICTCREELLSCMHEGVDYLVQEYIDKDCELDIMGFSWNHGNEVFIPAVVRKVRETLTRQSDYIRLEPVSDYPALSVDAIEAFVREVGYEGIFSVEMIRRGGKFYFLEMNLRNDGVGWLYTKSGANFPYMWVQYCNGDLSRKSLATAKLRMPLTLMQLWDVLNLKAGKVPFRQWIKECLGADAHFLFDAKDIKPFLYLIHIFCRQGMKRALRLLQLTR